MFLGLTEGASEDTKARYGFVYGENGTIPAGRLPGIGRTGSPRRTASWSCGSVNRTRPMFDGCEGTTTGPRSRLHFRPEGGAGMSMQGPGGAGGRDPGAQRWGAEKQQIDKQAQEEHLVHEAQRIHAEEAAERGEAKPKRPWWKFWA